MKKTLRKTTLIVLVATFVIYLPVFTHAAKKSENSDENVVARVTVVRGLIQNVANDSIVVNSNRYTITGVPIEKPLGKPAKKDDLQQGKKAALFFENNRLTNILIYEGDVAP